MPVSDWAKALTEEVFGPAPVEVGKRYEHPEDGVITITSGQYWGEHGISNFWYWTVEATGEKKHGYGGSWKEVTE